MTEAKKPELLHLESVDKISKLPVVEYAWNQTVDLYGKVKESNGMVNWTLSTAEATVKKGLEQAAPLAKRFEQPINMVDETLVKGLNTMEEKVPIIKQQPQEVYDAAKTYMSSTLQPAMNKVTAMRDYGWNKANEMLNTKYGLIAVTSLDATADLAENYLDHYLPPTEEEKAQEPSEKIPATEDKVMHTVEIAGRLSNKIRRRVYRALVLQMKGLKQQSEQTISTLASTLDLLQLSKLNVDPKALAEKVNALWAELNKEGGDEPATTLEQRSLVLARKLTRGVLSFCSHAQDTLSLLPANLKTKMEEAAQYAVDMYGKLKTATVQEITEAFMSQMKDSVGKIQTIMKDMNDYASGWLENWVSKVNAQQLPPVEDKPGDLEMTSLAAQPAADQAMDILTPEVKPALVELDCS